MLCKSSIFFLVFRCVLPRCVLNRKSSGGKARNVFFFLIFFSSCYAFLCHVRNLSSESIRDRFTAGALCDVRWRSEEDLEKIKNFQNVTSFSTCGINNNKPPPPSPPGLLSLSPFFFFFFLKRWAGREEMLPLRRALQIWISRLCDQGKREREKKTTLWAGEWRGLCEEKKKATITASWFLTFLLEGCIHDDRHWRDP